MKRSIWMLTLAALVFGGCANTQLQTPSGFAVHETDETYDYRASDGEGVVLAVRKEKNRLGGDLAYWTSTLDVELRQQGYEARSLTEVTSANGLTGQQIRYALPYEGRELAFWVTLFVTPRQVVIVEAGGDTEFFSAKSEVVEKAIASLQVG